MLKAIVFDFDGIVADSEPLHHEAFRRMTAPMGLDISYGTYAEKYLGYDDRDFFRVVLRELGRCDEAADNERIAVLCQEKQEVFEAVVSEGVAAIPGVLELIEEAKSAMPVAVASGATRRDIEMILSRLSLEGVFAPIVTADDVQQSKPHPQTYRLAASGVAARHPELGIEPGDCLAIEDSAPGLESALGAGLMTLGVGTTGPVSALHRANRAVASFEGVTLETLRAWFG